MQGSQSWRELLGQIIKNPKDKQHVANELSISPITLGRWVSGESKPLLQNLRMLLDQFPEYRQQFLELLLREFGPSFVQLLTADATSHEVPTIFYTRVLHAYCAIPEILHFNSICDIVLLQALKQLDPGRLGMEISLITCMPPSTTNKVRSLYETMTRSTYALSTEGEARALFFGVETLMGYVVSTGRVRVVKSVQDELEPFLDARMQDKACAMIYPILMADRIAGCLLFLSTQFDYFLLPARQQLIQQYTELLTLAFSADDFYPFAQIELGRMPAYKIQRSSLATFRSRVARRMTNSHVSIAQAERFVLQQIEAELLLSFAHEQ